MDTLLDPLERLSTLSVSKSDWPLTTAAGAALSFDPVLILELLALGLVAGFLAGLLGIGGGMMMVPFLTLIMSHRGVDAGMAVKMAIATAMASVMFTSLSSLRAHHKRGAVRWDLVRGMAPGLIVGGLLSGAGIFSIIKGNSLAFIFAGFVGFSAVQMLRNKKPKPGREMPGAAGQISAGVGIGMLSGLVGAGGAFMSVPFMTRGNVTMHSAVATSAAIGFPVALANTLGYVIGGWSLPETVPYAYGFLYLPALLVISSTSVLMAPIGARTAHAMDVSQLKRTFACLLFLIAGYMLYKGLTA